MTGTHVLMIEACETQCGWCDYETRGANNLRVVRADPDSELPNPVCSSIRNIQMLMRLNEACTLPSRKLQGREFEEYHN